MSTIPIVKSGNQALDLWQSRLKSELDPVLSNPIVNGLLLPSLQLMSGVNVINHLLGRNQIGWFIVDQNGTSQFHRSAPLNSKTLTLQSTNAVVASIWVF